MNEQLSFLQIQTHPGSARHSDPDTSKDAARKLDTNHIEKLVTDALTIIGPIGATTEELASDLNLPLVTVSPRMRPLARKNRVRDSGERRKNESGRAAIVWVREYK